eukprot:372141_1
MESVQMHNARSSMNSKELTELFELSQQLEGLSDAYLLEDHFNELCLPSLSGVMIQSSKSTVDDASLFRGWCDMNSFKGGSETFMTRPSRREQLLIS